MVCHICLDVPKTPVVTPCGHIFCLECLVSSSQKSPDAMQAPCPTCRSNFSLVSPDPAFVPEKYRRFIDSSIRKVYMDNSAEATLQSKVAQLEARVKSLEREKDLLIVKCESRMAVAESHAEGEREARIRCATLQKELKQANQCFASLIEKGVRLESILGPTPPRVGPSTCLDGADHPTSVPGSNKRRSSSSATGNNHSSVLAPIDVDIRPAVPLPKRCRVSRRPRSESP